MKIALLVVAALGLGFFALLVLLQVTIRVRANALRGKPLPALPGELGRRVGRKERALIYFFTPQCAACRAITPQMRALSDKGRPVFLVNAMQEPSAARALSVMATPSTVEVDHGTIVAVHVGVVPREVLARFA